LKRLVLIIISALICGMAFTNCSSNKDERTKGTLYAMGEQSVTAMAKSSTFENQPPLEMVFTGDDIISFDVTSNKILFTDEISDKLANIFYRKLTLYLNDELLFGEIKPVYPFESNRLYDCVVLYVSAAFDDVDKKWIIPKFILIDGESNGPELGNIDDPIKRENDWNGFIKYLNDAGKIAK